jgi:putative oxidoreductase
VRGFETTGFTLFLHIRRPIGKDMGALGVLALGKPGRSAYPEHRRVRGLLRSSSPLLVDQRRRNSFMVRPIDSGVIFFARIALAVLFLWGGVMKLLSYAGFVGYLHAKGVPFVEIGAPVATAIELVGGLLLVVGFLTRPLAIVMAIYTVIAAMLGHDFWNPIDAGVQREMIIHFWKNIGIAGGFLLLFVTGAGGLSIDAARAPRRHML